MICDYYICKYLKIEFQSILPLFIELEKDRGYFNFYLDEDEPDYDKKHKKYLEETLTPRMKPIIVYEKNEFVNTKLENKYKLLVKEELDRFNISQVNKLEWSDILDIKKVEIRFTR